MRKNSIKNSRENCYGKHLQIFLMSNEEIESGTLSENGFQEKLNH